MPKVARKSDPVTSSASASAVKKPRSKPGSKSAKLVEVWSGEGAKLPIKKQRLVRMIKDDVDDLVKGEFAGDVKEGAKIKLRKDAAIAMHQWFCPKFVRGISTAHMLTRHAKRQTFMGPDLALLESIEKA
jgi:histone H3/H4